MLRTPAALLCFLCVSCATTALAYRPASLRVPHGVVGLQKRAATKKDDATDESKEVSLPVKAAWFATEAFGRVMAGGAPVKADSKSEGAPRSIQELQRRLAADYEAETPYFLSGRFDKAAYAEDCEFADPFVSFNGRDRFEANLANLAGGFITESAARPLGDARVDDTQFFQKFLVKLRLALPWQPVLAWPWGVTHIFGEGPDPGTFVVVRHVESWDVDTTNSGVSPEEGLRQLFRPGRDAIVAPASPSSSSSSSSDDDDDPDASPNALGRADPIVGPLVAAARRVGALPASEAGGWTGEPLAWADADSLAQRFSGLSQRFLAGFKQWAADRVAGDYDANAVDARIDGYIDAGGCVVFAFTSCPFCKKACDVLDGYGAAYEVVNLDLDADGPAIRAQLGRRTGRTSVPAVWIGGEYVGGMNDGSPGLGPLDAQGALLPKLKAAGSVKR